MSFSTPAHKNVAHPAGQVSNPRVAVTKVPGFTFTVEEPVSLEAVTINKRVDQFIAAVQEHTNAYTAKNFKSLQPAQITAPAPWGAKFIRIVRGDVDGVSRSVHCFINRSNGDILMAAGWKAPAKHARGNIFADDLGMSCMDPYGPRYLR